MTSLLDVAKSHLASADADEVSQMQCDSCSSICNIQMYNLRCDHIIFIRVQKRLEADIHKLCALPTQVFSVTLPESRDKPCFDLEILAGLINALRNMNSNFIV